MPASICFWLARSHLCKVWGRAWGGAHQSMQAPACACIASLGPSGRASVRAGLWRGGDVCQLIILPCWHVCVRCVLVHALEFSMPSTDFAPALEMHCCIVAVREELNARETSVMTHISMLLTHWSPTLVSIECYMCPVYGHHDCHICMPDIYVWDQKGNSGLETESCCCRAPGQAQDRTPGTCLL